MSDRHVVDEWAAGDLLVTKGGRVAHAMKYAWDEPGWLTALCGSFVWRPARRMHQPVCPKCITVAAIARRPSWVVLRGGAVGAATADPSQEQA